MDDGWVGGRKDGSQSRDKILSSKNLGRWMDGWVEGRKEGSQSRVKDCLQQSKNGKSQKQAGLAEKIENHKKSNTKILKDD